MHLPRLLACLPLLLLVLSGCSTPESRIEKNPAAFAALNPEQQAAVRGGRVDIGFTKDMVYLALGTADRTYGRTTTQGEVEVWAYTDVNIRHEQQLAPTQVRYRDSQGRLRTATDSTWVTIEHREVFDRIRLEFNGGKVSAIDRINP